jgi:hypothetical protein
MSADLTTIDATVAYCDADEPALSIRLDEFPPGVDADDALDAVRINFAGE